MKPINLTQGKVTLVDDEDYSWLSKYGWIFSKGKKYANGKQYGKVVTGIYQKDTKRNKIVTMHRMIMNPNSSQCVDHINGNPLDNRKCNLRICTISQNNKNKISKSRDGFKGVYPVNNTNHWYSKIMVNRKRIYLGVFKTKLEAAFAYNEAALKFHGKYAAINNI